MAVPTTVPHELRTSFGNWLKEQRKEVGLTQEQAAQKAGIVRQQWMRIEAGDSGTRRETIPGIARAVNADIDETYERAGFSATQVVSVDDRVARLLSRMTPRKKELAVTFLETLAAA